MPDVVCVSVVSWFRLSSILSHLHPHPQDLVLSTQDRPIGLSLDPSGDDEPVFRFCKGESHADIMVPNFHFHMVRAYLSSSLSEGLSGG